jgi:hypothetical protein
MEENQAVIFAGQNAGSFTELFTRAAGRKTGAAGAGICSSSILLKVAHAQKRGHQY